MAKIVVESVHEFRNLRTLNEQEELNEITNPLDFVKGPRGWVKKALANLKDEKIINNALCTCFAGQCGKSETWKKSLLGLSLDKKIDVINQCAKWLKDSAIGILTLKNVDGKLVVSGGKPEGGAGEAIKAK